MIKESSQTEDKIDQPSNKQEIPNSNSDIVINLAYCRYPIVEEIASKDYGFYISKDPKVHWDILWTDTVSFNLKYNLIPLIALDPRENKLP